MTLEELLAENAELQAENARLRQRLQAAESKTKERRLAAHDSNAQDRFRRPYRGT